MRVKLAWVLLHGWTWGDKNNVTLMNDLQVQQSKAAKIILNQPIFLSSTEALDSLNGRS